MQLETQDGKSEWKNKDKDNVEVKVSPIMRPYHAVYSIPTCGAKCGRRLLGRFSVQSVLELGHSTKHIAKLGPHEEAASVSARPRALQDGLQKEQTGG